MNDVAVLTSTGKPLMPTNRARARQLLKKERAVIESYRPVFTIRLLDREDGDVQEVELKVDTGYKYIGISVCSGKHEYIHHEYELYTDEPERHRTRCALRRARRNRKTRYRKSRFLNRKGRMCKDGFVSSLRNKRDRHVDLVKAFCRVLPVTDAYIELGQFDTQVLKAVEEGKPLPQGEDYQHGEQYGFATLREAVFTRDGHACACCGRTPWDNGAILHVHHIGFWKQDRTNRMANLMTVCEKCHTAKDHKQGGKLYGLEPKLKEFRGATFMTIIRYSMLEKMKEACPQVRFHATYGAATKLARKKYHVGKSHAGDAYAMGTLHPKHRGKARYFRKRRRNDRILEIFYDATYTDIRTGKKVKAAQLGCSRTKRSIPRDNPGNERIYRGKKCSNGGRHIRKERPPIQPGSMVRCNGELAVVKGAHRRGDGKWSIEFTEPLSNGKKSSMLHLLSVVRKAYKTGWEEVPT